MKSNLMAPPRRVFQTFMDFPLETDLDALDAHVAIMGIPYGDPYSIDEVTNDQTHAPTAIRRASQRLSVGLAHYDFDIGGTLFDGKDIKVVDIGDTPGKARDLDHHYRIAEAAARKVFAKGGRLITFGGDHGVPIPVMRALDSKKDVTLVQIDAHMDWRDDVNGAREGYSSPIRRASEMDHIGQIFQIGIRAQGSARTEDVDAALAYGANIITAYDVHDSGMQSVLDRIPDGGTYYLTSDADGMDPSIAPAVMALVPGGILYPQMRTLIHGLVKKGNLIGMDVNEITPKFDHSEVTCVLAGRLVINYIGTAVRAGYFE
jgi:agmatinase